MVKLPSMRYKSFTWENNPATCTYSCERTYVAHKYPEIAGVELEDMDVNEVIITGKGEFFGQNAYKNWIKLNAEFKTFGPGSFYHPIFGDITQALMTKLQAELEPRESYVAYSFEIVGETGINDVVNIPSIDTTTDTKIKVGDTVILTGYAYYDSYGSLPRSNYRHGTRHTVTYVNYKGTHPIHCSLLGWCRLQDVKLASSVSTDVITNNTNDIVHTVKHSETLSGICAKYGVTNWKAVAEYNNLRDPHMIFVGNQILIPRSMITNTTPTSSGVGSKNVTGSRSSAPAGGGTNVSHTIN